MSSPNLNPGGPMRPLSIGNVVSASFRLYSSHLKQYFGIACKAYLWVLVPVYGWAKYSALSASISRLAFGELVNQPESTSTAEQRTNARKWSFLLAGLFVGLLALGIVLACSIVLGVAVGILAFVIGAALGNSVLAAVVGGIFVVIAVLAFTVGLLWISARFLVVEVPLALEDNMTASKAISRSWDLSQGLIWQLVGVVSVAFLITIPIQLLFQVVISVLQAALGQDSVADSALSVIFSVLILSLSLLSGMIIMPFWQALKAVVYYDLRSRREGLGLKLRDR
ncbi:DUF975 domain-containing protein [Trichocoleus sp. FACHB-262]|uniref:DUF975 domain-containing protein n=1 Tax=Trichocoleus sp. FACHB-262 TaxID=2692869 RepID=UPI0018F011F5|nr:DUF975 domain-containing protein [Trichocoleus sp. FACHB-262]